MTNVTGNQTLRTRDRRHSAPGAPTTSSRPSTERRSGSTSTAVSGREPARSRARSRSAVRSVPRVARRAAPASSTARSTSSRSTTAVLPPARVLAHYDTGKPPPQAPAAPSSLTATPSGSTQIEPRLAATTRPTSRRSSSSAAPTPGSRPPTRSPSTCRRSSRPTRTRASTRTARTGTASAPATSAGRRLVGHRDGYDRHAAPRSSTTGASSNVTWNSATPRRHASIPGGSGDQLLVRVPADGDGRRVHLDAAWRGGLRPDRGRRQRRR